MEPLINRDPERERLLALAGADRPRLALITGRRRIGKTFLLTNMWGETPIFYFTAANTTAVANRRQLIIDLGRQSAQDLRPEDFPTWRTVFRALLTGEHTLRVLIIDEFQYLADDERGLREVASELNAVWEQPGVRPRLLVLSGSALSTMNALAAGGSPLYGRFNYQRTLRPFDHYYARELTQVTDARTAVQVYACLGGTPRYLAAYDQRVGFRQNLQRLLLSPEGEVRQLIETALEQEEGLRDVAAYRAILDAVAAGLTERNDIAQRVGLSNDAGLRRRLAKLIELGYLTGTRNFAAKPNAAIRYRLADLAFRFHSYFVAPHRSQLDRLGAEVVYRESVGPQMDTYVGKAFETIAHEAITQLGASGSLPTLSEIGQWEGADRDRRSVEIDTVGRTFDGRLVTGEVKWNRRAVGPALHRDHLDKLGRLAGSGHSWAREALQPDAQRVYVSASGFTEEWAGVEEVTLLGLDDLYAVAP